MVDISVAEGTEQHGSGVGRSLGSHGLDVAVAVASLRCHAPLWRAGEFVGLALLDGTHPCCDVLGHAGAVVAAGRGEPASPGVSRACQSPCGLLAGAGHRDQQLASCTAIDRTPIGVDSAGDRGGGCLVLAVWFATLALGVDAPGVDGSSGAWSRSAGGCCGAG